MKSLLKLGSLFALIIAGRYMQSVTPLGVGIQHKAPLASFNPKPPTLSQFIGYTKAASSPVTPVSEHKQLTPTWY